MSDLEDRLKNAIDAAVAGAEPRPGVMTAVRRRDLNVGQILPVPQHQHRSLPWGERGQGSQQQVTVGYLPNLVPGRWDRRIHVQGQFSAPPQHPPPVNRGIHQHPAHVRLGAAAVPEQQPPAAIGALKRDLQQVLRRGFVPAGEHQRQPEQVRGTAADELLEGAIGLRTHWCLPYWRIHTSCTIPTAGMLHATAIQLPDGAGAVPSLPQVL